MFALTRGFFALALGFALLAAPVRAEESLPPEARALIQQQLDAFAHDDANAAYALASPGIKALFPDAQAFMSMVKTSYPPIYRHRSVEFGPAAEQGDQVEQAVTIVDDDNEVWNAVYMLAREPDGKWVTTGCVLSRSEQVSL